MLAVENLTEQEFGSYLCVLSTIIKVVGQEFGNFLKLSASDTPTNKVTELTLLRIHIFPATNHTKPTPSSIASKSIFAKIAHMVLKVRMCERLVFRVEMIS